MEHPKTHQQRDRGWEAAQRWRTASATVVGTFGGACLGAAVSSAGAPAASPLLMGGLGGVLLLGTVGLSWAQLRDRGRPALFYVRGLLPGMGDFYANEWNGQAVRFHGGTFREPLSEHGLDVAVRVSELANEFQAGLVSAGRAERTLAPNLLWPMAMSLGSQVGMTEVLLLQEIGRLDGQRTITWRLQERAPADDREVPSLEVQCDPARETTYVIIDLADAGYTQVQEQWPVGSKTRLAFLPPATGVAWPAALTVRAHPTDYRFAWEDEVVVHPRTLVDAVAAAVRRLVHEHPSGALILSGRMPKTVAYGVGWRLANPDSRPGCEVPGCSQPGCQEPWRQIVPIHFDRDRKHYIPVRAHPSQPSLSDLAKRLEAGHA